MGEGSSLVAKLLYISVTKAKAMRALDETKVYGVWCIGDEIPNLMNDD